MTDRCASRVSSDSTNSFSSAVPDLPSLSNPLNLYHDPNPMTTSIYGNLDRDQRLGEETPGSGVGNLNSQRLSSQRHYSLESFEFPDMSASISAPATQPTSPVDGHFPSLDQVTGANAIRKAANAAPGTTSAVAQTSLQRQDTIDFPTNSMSRSTTSDSFDAFSLLDEVEFPAPPEDLMAPPPCPSGLYGSLMTAQHHGGAAGNLVNAAFGGMLPRGGVGGGVGGGRGDRGTIGGSSGAGLRNVSPMTTQNSASTANGVKSDSISLASNASAEGRPCLLEVNRVTLSDMDLFSGVWVSADDAEEEIEGVPDELQFAGR